MASKFLKGGALARAQVDTLTVGGTVEIGDKFLATLTAEDGSTTQTVTKASTTTSTSTTATEIAAALTLAATNTDSTFKGLFENITFQVSGSTIICTANKPGVPFYLTVTTTESDDSAADAQTFSRAATTANRGPNDINSVDNLSDGVALTTGDTLIVDGRANGTSILYGLAQSGVTLAHLDIRSSYTGDIGAFVNFTGLTVTNFKLKISATLLTIGQRGDDGGSASGSRLINLDLGSNASTMRVMGTANTGKNGMPPVMLKNVHASSSLTISGSSWLGVGVATPAETSTVPTVINSARAGCVTLGTGVTLTDVTNTMQCGARTVTNTAIGGTLKILGGVVETYGAVLIATAQLDAGTWYCNNRAAPAITTFNLNGGIFDATRDARSFSITTTNPNAKGSFTLRPATRTQITFADGAIAIPLSNEYSYNAA